VGIAEVDRGARRTIRFEVNVAPNQSSVKHIARVGPWLRGEEAKHGPDRDSDDSEPQRDHAQPVCESRIAAPSHHRVLRLAPGQPAGRDASACPLNPSWPTMVKIVRGLGEGFLEIQPVAAD